MRNPWVVPVALGLVAALGGVTATILVGAPASAASRPAAGGGQCISADYPPAQVGVQISTGVVIAGGAVTVTGEGFAPGVVVLLDLEPGAVVLAHVMPDSSGRFRAAVTIPATTAPGAYEIVATGGCPADVTQTQHLTVRVTVTGSGAPPGRPPAPPANPGALAITGTESLLTVAASLTLILIGSAIVLVGRRRRMTSGTTTYPRGRI